MFSKDIEKNIFRASLTTIAPNDEGWPLLFSYEREIHRPFTLVVGIGPSFRTSFVDESELAIHGFASIELRYYFNLFLGPGLYFTDLEKGEWIMIDDFHLGITFGFVLFE